MKPLLLKGAAWPCSMLDEYQENKQVFPLTLNYSFNRHNYNAAVKSLAPSSLYLRRFLRELISRVRPSLASVASSSSLCSFLREALALVASSSASSSCRFSCFIRELAFSIWRDGEMARGQLGSLNMWATWLLMNHYLLFVLVSMTTLILHLHHHLLQLLLRTSDNFVGCSSLPGG